jgi:hypothetical protein
MMLKLGTWKWIGSWTIVIAVFARAVGIHPFPIIDYILSLIGTILMLYVAIKENDRQYVLLCVAILIPLMIGIILLTL